MGAQRRDTSTPRDARRDYEEGPLSACLLPVRSAGAARLSYVAPCVRSDALAANDSSKFLCYKFCIISSRKAGNILPDVMDVSWRRPPGLGYPKVDTAILRKYVFELSQIRFF